MASPVPARHVRGTELDPVLEPVVHDAAVRGERLVSISRAVFCTLVLLRFMSFDQGGNLAPYLVNLPALALAIGYSLWLLWRIGRGRAGYSLLALSVGVDALACFTSLLQTALWPATGESYRGLLTTPDVTALLVIVYAAGFRVWPRLAALGALLNLLSFATLMVIERSVRGSRLGYGGAEVLMFFLVVGCVVILSIGTAKRTLELVADGATATVQVERARQKLAELVREHHDARSTINAAALSSDLMVRVLEDRTSDSGLDASLRRQAERLRRDLDAARQQLSALGEKAYMDLTTLGTVEPISAATLSHVVAAVRLRFPELQVEFELGDNRDFLVVGGAATMQRILYNLLNNAREGDGKSGASRVKIRLLPDGARVRLLIDDDGPGFDSAALMSAPARPMTTKPTGMGLGLFMTSELTRASGGSLELGNLPEGGARSTLILPAASNAPS